MIGLAIDGDAKLGVVFQPEPDRLYRGVIGDSAFVEEGPVTYDLRVTDRADPATLRLVSSRSHRSQTTDEMVSRLGIEEELRSGSVGLKCGLIAAAKADLYVHLSDKTMAWDTCAPEAILRAAGGRMTDLAGAPFLYGGDLQNRHGILACNQVAYDAVFPEVKRAAKDKGLV